MKFEIIKIIMILSTFLFATIISPTTMGILVEKNLEYEYYTYSEMTDLLQNLESQHPDIIKVESYGKTYQNRDIWFVKISDNVEINENEPGILLLGAHHGDEKLSYELLIFFIKHMIENYYIENTDNDDDGFTNEDIIDGKDNDNDGQIDEDPSEDRVRAAINNTQIFLFPMVNPDGVEANTRKNCNPNSENGVNTNRNFGYDWKYYNLFPNLYGYLWAISETSGNYRGSSPYSESETQAVKRAAESFTINISLSYHSGAEVVFFPWYHTTAKTPHEDLFITVGEDMSEISGYPLYIGDDYIIPKYGGTLGTSENYLYGEHKILAYTVESHRRKVPTTTTSVISTCLKNVGVHLYLCERSQTVDNNKAFISKNIENQIPFVFSLFNKMLNLISYLFR